VEDIGVKPGVLGLGSTFCRGWTPYWWNPHFYCRFSAFFCYHASECTILRGKFEKFSGPLPTPLGTYEFFLSHVSFCRVGFVGVGFCRSVVLSEWGFVGVWFCGSGVLWEWGFVGVWFCRSGVLSRMRCHNKWTWITELNM